MAKQLRLEVAELTDVGRKRDSNEDNMTRLVPKDPELLEQKGAIFVVADGMGGHAAGEVASEIAVETIREEYYEATSQDIAEVLAQTIKQANQVIYDRATEQAGRAGMGTTCVVAVVRGSLAYLANVGDSRAYLIRDGQIRQLTYDHSWVAEQVRAGMLTEGQARTHSHRNVITRALGTQPVVEPDLFIEPLQDGDMLLLCSDGLSGYVSDEEINRIINSSSPHEGVHTLISQANEHGGPDNITAVLVHAIEVPPLTPEVRERLATLNNVVKEPSGTLRLTKRRKKLTPLQIAFRIFAGVAALFLFLAAWDFGFGPIAATRAAHTQLNTDLDRAHLLVAQAQQQKDPIQAINALAAAQHPLLNDLHNPHLSADDHQRASTALEHEVAPAIRLALEHYNTAALLKPLSALKPRHLGITCPAAPGGQIDQVVAVQGPTSALAGSATSPGITPAAPLLFARAHPASTSGLSALYPLTIQTDGQAATCGAQLETAVVTVTSDGMQVYVLHEVSPTTFSLEAITADGQVQTIMALPPGAIGAQPTLIAVRGTTKAILYRSAASDTIVLCPDTQPTNCHPQGPTQLPRQARSLAFGPNGSLYLLLVDGSLAALLPDGSFHPVTISALYPALPTTDPDSFSPVMTLPTVPPIPTFSSTPAPGASPTPSPDALSTPSPTATPGAGAAYTPSGVKLLNATTLISDQQNHLFIGDGAEHRIIRLDVPPTGTADPMPGLQYADPSALDSLLSLTALSTSEQAYSLYALSGHSLLVITLP